MNMHSTIMKRLILLITISLFSCIQKNQFESICFGKLMIDFPNEQNCYAAYLLIPSNTCASCDGFTMQKSIEIIKNDLPIMVIYECYPSNYKTLSFRLSGLNCKGYNIDTLTRYKFNDNDRLKDLPIIIYLDGSNLKSIEVQNSQNPEAINKLIYKYL